MQSKTKFSLTNLAKQDYYISSPFLITNVIKKLENDWHDINNFYGKPLYSYPTNILQSHFNNTENMYSVIQKDFQKEIKKEIQKDTSFLRQKEKVENANEKTAIRNVTKFIPTEFSKLSNEEKRKIYQERVNNAIKKNEIFSIMGNYSVIRKELAERGWIEKMNRNSLTNLQGDTIDNLMKYTALNNDYERVVLSKMLNKNLSKFICGGEKVFSNVICCVGQTNKPIIYPFFNRIKMPDKKYDFTNKEGLIECIKKTTKQNGLTEVKTPAFHHLHREENLDFLRDYRTIYCLTLLLFIDKSSHIEDLFTTHGSVSLQILTMAIDRIRGEINFRKSNSNISRINRILKDDHCVPCKRWENFYYSTNQVISGRLTFLCKTNNTASQISKKIKLKLIKELIEESKTYWPILSSYGFYNLWILKPGHSCQGKGICIKRNYIDILNFVRHRKVKHYIVQKYIEKPLLIYKTKFDIRQHMLISISHSHLTVWMYKDCYLRFASHEYQTNNLHRAIHITNHSVQKRFRNGRRNIKLPPHNMWSLSQFKHYLDENNRINIWNDQIYPDMKAMLISIISVSLNNFNFIPNTFELYGCDFMLDEDLTPILLEINGNPDMTPSTIITEKLCPQVFLDTVKVVVDLQYYPSLSTGAFELIYDYDYTKIKT